MAKKTNKEVETPAVVGVSDLDNSFDMGIVKPEYLEPFTISLVSTPMMFIVDFGIFLTHDYFVNREVKLTQLNNTAEEDIAFLEKRFKCSIEYFVKNALIGWKNAYSKGEEVEFSKEKALEYFKVRPNVYTELESKCLHMLVNMTEQKELDVKN